MRHHLWPLQMFAILLQFLEIALNFQAGLFKTRVSGLEMFGGGGASQIGHRWVTSHKHHLVLVSDELQA